MLSLDHLSGFFEDNSSISALSPTISRELFSPLSPHSQQGSILPPESPREIDLYGDIWNVPGISQQPQLDHSTYNPSQPLPVPETGDTAPQPEVAPTPQRRRRNLGRSYVGQNPYGRNGTLRCELCRRWRRKVYSTVL